MTTLPLPGADAYTRQGWLASVVCHGLVALGAMLLLSDIRLAPRPEPFTWEVALVEPQREVVPDPAPAQPSPPSPTPPQRQPVRQQPVEPKPVVQEVEPVHQQPVQHVVHRVVQRDVRPIVESRLEPVQQPVERIQDVVPVEAETVTLPNPEPVTREAPVTTAEPVMRQEPAVEAPAEPVVTKTVEAPTPALVQRPVETIEHAPAPSALPPITRELATTAPAEPVHQQVASLPKPAEAVERALQARAAAKADFSWLANDLRRRIEQLKRYPHLARMNRWEGKVILQAVIREDGQVVELKVTESSGHAVLDQAAMDVMRRASPLDLKHPLGQAQIVVQVPISYRLQN